MSGLHTAMAASAVAFLAGAAVTAVTVERERAGNALTVRHHG